MANVEVKEFKIKIGEKEYTFRLDFVALLKYSNRHEDALEIFNNFLRNIDPYGCAIKVMSCACVERDFTESELAEVLPFNLRTMKAVDEIATALIEGVLDYKESSEGGQGKNE